MQSLESIIKDSRLSARFCHLRNNVYRVPAALIPFLSIKAPPTILLFPPREEPITQLTRQISHLPDKSRPYEQIRAKSGPGEILLLQMKRL